MSIISKEQIGSIAASLKKIGILYVDILHEMTDHIAAILEKMDGDFEINLSHYIIMHKKELRRFNRKFILISWMQSYKALLLNMLTIRFAGFFGLVYLIATGLSLIMERDSFVMIMFFVFIIANTSISFPGVYNMIKKRDQYSAGEGLSIVNLFVFFPGLFMIGLIRELESDIMVVLYFTVLISICAVMAKTLRNFISNYKLRYNG